MTFSYKQKKPLIPKRFNLISLILISFLLGIPSLMTFSPLEPKKEIWQEENSFLTKEEGFAISFNDFIPPSSESYQETLPIEEIPSLDYKEPIEEKFNQEEEEIKTSSLPESLESFSSNQSSSSSEEEKRILDELAYELSRTFSKVKYYSSQSRKDKLEGESLLLVKISEKGEILEVKRKDNLLGHLSEDLNYSIERLKKNWHGKNKAKKEVTLQMKVTYKLI